VNKLNARDVERESEKLAAVVVAAAKFSVSRLLPGEKPGSLARLRVGAPMLLLAAGRLLALAAGLQRRAARLARRLNAG